VIGWGRSVTRIASIRDTSQSRAEISKPHPLDTLLKPASIALVGASAKVNTPGNTMLRAVAADGYSGRVYPVNPKYDLIEGIPCFSSLADLPETVDHVVLGLANEQLEEGLKQAVHHGRISPSRPENS